jgi:NAD(P)-dependent dehydrogenase (short-subunit alcohol dehydrogenase family)
MFRDAARDLSRNSEFLNSLCDGEGLRTRVLLTARRSYCPNVSYRPDLFGHSLVYGVQDCLRAGLFDWGGRILALTTAGGGPGKAVVEAHIRELARDLAPAGITANTILAGVVESPALRTNPGYDEFLKQARMRNPHRRLTMPEDVVRCIAALCHPATYWMMGNTLCTWMAARTS